MTAAALVVLAALLAFPVIMVWGLFQPLQLTDAELTRILDQTDAQWFAADPEGCRAAGYAPKEPTE